MSPADRPIPRATYRLQLTRDFTFADAAALAPYLGRLGISHAYLSPILKARPGSTHGYDTVDHTILNPELGTLADFRAMAAELKAAGVSIILDIVPNHMGIGTDQNPLWLDVLEGGQASRYADWFDIDWTPTEPTLHGKLLVPFLGTSFAEALAAGRLELRLDKTEGSFAIWAEATHKLPLRIADYPSLLSEAGLDHLDASGDALKHVIARALENPAATAALDAVVASLNSPSRRENLSALIGRQHWRAAHFSVAADDINYRRFFIVSDLAAIRIERDDVFTHVHALTFQLVAEGLVDGLRVDHIDGLYDPAAYCRCLRAACPRPIYLVVEKILAPHEQLRADWDVDGTTGYEFAGAITRLLADPAGEAPLTATYNRFTGTEPDFDDIEYRSKLLIVDREMTAELDALATRLRRLAAADPATADLTRHAIRTALRGTVAALSVYRTYVAAGSTAWDRRMIGVAIARARRRTPELDPAVFAFLERAMAGDGPARDVAQRLQQYTGPVMAKGLEDTALYRYNRLLALSDVGAKPDRFSLGIPGFHDFMRARQRLQPHGMLSSSSHDTKRGEDVRARIVALSGHAEAWDTRVTAWRDQLARQGAPELAPDDTYAFFQLLLGAWPAELGPDQPPAAAALENFRTRIAAAMLKSIREARLRTSWTAPDADYEARLAAFVETALAAGPNPFLADFREFEHQLAWHGACNGLIATTIKLTAPGIPDIYQGAELWEQSMVDPDNRRPVDFDRRAALLQDTDLADLRPRFRTGGIKQVLIARLLQLRAKLPKLFSDGDYRPVHMADDRLLTFERVHGDRALLVAVALYPWRGAPPTVPLPPCPIPGKAWRDALGAQPSSTLFTGDLPIAVFVAE